MDLKFIANTKNEDILNRKLWIKITKYFISLIRYLFQFTHLTFFIFLKHKVTVQLKQFFTNYSIPTFLISKNAAKIQQQQFVRKALSYFTKLTRLAPLKKIYLFCLQLIILIFKN